VDFFHDIAVNIQTDNENPSAATASDMHLKILETLIGRVFSAKQEDP
jgi:hypothetical protein